MSMTKIINLHYCVWLNCIQRTLEHMLIAIVIRTHMYVCMCCDVSHQSYRKTINEKCAKWYIYYIHISVWIEKLKHYHISMYIYIYAKYICTHNNIVKFDEKGIKASTFMK